MQAEGGCQPRTGRRASLAPPSVDYAVSSLLTYNGVNHRMMPQKSCTYTPPSDRDRLALPLLEGELSAGAVLMHSQCLAMERTKVKYLLERPPV